MDIFPEINRALVFFICKNIVVGPKSACYNKFINDKMISINPNDIMKNYVTFQNILAKIK